MTRSRLRRRRVSIAAALILLVVPLIAQNRADAGGLESRNASTVVTTQAAGVAFPYRVEVANGGGKPIRLEAVELVAATPGVRVVDVTGMDRTVGVGSHARVTLSLEISGEAAQQHFQALEVRYTRDGGPHTQRMAFKLVACPEPAASCEPPPDWE